MSCISYITRSTEGLMFESEWMETPVRQQISFPEIQFQYYD